MKFYYYVESALNVFQEWTKIMGCISEKFIFLYILCFIHIQKICFILLC